MDSHSLEVRFLSAVQALATASQAPRSVAKAISDLPESTKAAEAIKEAALEGLSMDRLRTIVKCSQGDSRRGRAIATRILEWMDEGRPAPERPVAKATILDAETPGKVTELPDGFLRWQLANDAYSMATRQGILEEHGDGGTFSQATDIPHKGNGFKLPGEALPMPGTDEPKPRKVDPKTDLVD
jgi:hypothetical protein